MESIDKFQFENVDESIIEGCEWAQNLRKSLHSITDLAVLNWCKVVKELGENDLELEKWIDIFSSEIEERYRELVCDVVNMKVRVIDNIALLLEKVQNYARVLEIQDNLSEIDPNNNYYQVQKELIKRTDRFKEMIDERQRELDKLLEKQLNLCTLLQEDPILMPSSPLPRTEQVEQLQKYVEEMEHEKFNREERYLQLKEAIVNMTKQLEISPKSDFERIISSDTDQNMDISKSNMKLMQEFHDDLVVQIRDVREEIDKLRKSVDDLWKILEESITERDSFHERNQGYTMSTLKALRAEVKRCETLKKANIKIFVEKLRKEIRSLWRTCYHENEENSDDYPWFTSDFYTEDLLHYHEMQVETWRTFYTDNEELIKLIAEHESLWNHLLEMENKDAGGVDRYKNRGGQLLQEEKERNKLSKKIPLLETKIEALAHSYAELRGSPFKIFSVPISEYIENLHVQRDKERKIKLSARKQKNQETLTPARSCQNLFPSSSKLFTVPTPQSAMKRKLTNPSTSGKKPKVAMDVRKLKSCTTLNRSKRLSMDKKKRIVKCKKFLEMGTPATNKENHDATNMTDYNAFEKNLTSRQDNCRSTLVFDNNEFENIPVINLLPPTPVTPGRSNNPRNGRTTPRGKNKTPSKLKLIF